MDDNYLKLAAYWRNSLADAESGKGALEKRDTNNLTKWESVSSGRLDSIITERFFSDEKDDVNTVDVILRPKVFIRLIQHGKERLAGSPTYVTPLVTLAKINREGFLFPTSTTVIPRDLLEPLSHGSFSIGEISEYDKYKTTNTSSSMHYDESHLETEETEEEKEKRYEGYFQGWGSYLDDSYKLLNSIAESWINTHEQYELADYGYILKKVEPKGASTHILSLYDHLLVNKKKVPLFERFANFTSPEIEPLISTEDSFVYRLGHSGDRFPLALAQRDALGHFLNANDGDILAVNGPPGTGKTTLLLSIIATLWAKAALEQTNPPIVLATSTNNQAVTNIIEAFGKDFSEGNGAMSGRWLPNIKSFGAYFPSSTKKAEAIKKYQTDEFFKEIESKEYIESALDFYLNKAKLAFPNKDCSSPEKIIALLHEQLSEQSNKLVEIKQTWDSLQEIRGEIAQVSDDINSYLNDQTVLLSKTQSKIDRLKIASVEWDKYRANESLFISLFSWLPPVGKKRYYQVKLFLADKLDGFDIEKEPTEINVIDSLIKKLLDSEERKQEDYQQQINYIHQITQQEKEILAKWLTIASELGYKQGEEPNLLQIDELADTQIRFPLFLLTTHYWEGRWLIDVLNIDDLNKEKGRNGLKTVEPRWRRRMMLTPCVVMTCYMLPSHMVISEHKGQKGFENSYAYNLADLLIVDEAGQVLPEVAAASFSLAKKALVIGDTAQIPPIWNVTPSIDTGNMLEEKILAENTQEQINAEYESVTELGKSAASGSVMKIAQLSSRYHYDSDLERGMYLYEHRRCFDNIIGYCNELCYQGKLLPKRGDSDNLLFPAMGYLHIDGKGEQRNTGSRFNLLEAEIISAWLIENRQRIENHYGKPIQQIVGIVTPFSAQVSTIKDALSKQGITAETSENTLTVGTVHSLQGAERAIVIFSPVYSKHEDGGFIDSDNSMMNVAVSRAKDSFLVFGDMDLFEIHPPSSPRGLLAKYLFLEERNALHFEYKERQDLQKSNTQIYTLHGVKEHDDFLNQTISNTEKHITIISPWLNLQKLEQAGFIDSMAQATAKGIQVKVITDRNYNIQHSDPEKRKEREVNLHNALEQLDSYGIATKLVRRVHSKIVIGDDNLLCIGSFNWFSASREAKYERYDTSMVYCGGSLKEEIQAIHNNLERR
ncbi:TPA: DNA helicase [Providencia stuartii]|nr:DNA helicase [Providencia stuartii]